MMSLREVYVPPVRQPVIQPENNNNNDNGNRTPSINNTTTNNNGGRNNDADNDANVIIQSPIRRSNIVSAAATSHNVNQPACIPVKPRLGCARSTFPTPDQRVPYRCAACGFTWRFRSNDNLRCVKCGGATMYKPRVKQIAQYSTN
ncbi:uncharacterized protein B0H64DRAFT_22644 [Chaetomium fimeti]|uniref:Uncharacterized protein n=1 Tax=Chaetomium fimeti TaxID=1854472 RepID=A0AAE0HQE9_9PEZI|nr:hypothetical protein B0H64DRAFT_22644 [Chaetomium fimeti]